MARHMAHVFIVDARTFPVHLEYQFAGTTAGTKRQRYVPLYADIARVRPGDRAYFYLLNRGFYGPFKVDPDNRGVMWDQCSPTYLEDRLDQRLIFRVAVVADHTYPLPVSEWDALDKYLRDPERCLWSLVYRKLKGERGCTMIFPWEDDFLLGLIRQKNEAVGMHALEIKEGIHLTWNPSSAEIEVRKGNFPEYAPPRDDHISAPEDPAERLRLAAGSESHLQAFLTKNYGNFDNSQAIFGPTESLVWVGNEVACGVGMQKIDLFAINGDEPQRQFKVIELKIDPPTATTVFQLEKYIEWTRRFVPGATEGNIEPILLCRNLNQTPLPQDVKDSFHSFNQAHLALPVKYVECTNTRDDSLRFLEVRYN